MLQSPGLYYLYHLECAKTRKFSILDPISGPKPGSGVSPKKFQKKTYGHIFTSSSLDVAKPKSLLSVTTFKGSVHLDIADGAQSICAEIDVHNHELLIPEIYKKK